MATSGKIELPNKLGAIQLLAKMCGWLGPEEHEHGASNELVEVTRSGSGVADDTALRRVVISIRRLVYTGRP